MFAAIRVLGAESTGGVRSPQAIRRALVELARECSPKVERHGEDVVVVDASGLERLIGEAAAIGVEVQRQAEARGLRVMVALAATRVTALLFVHVTAVPPERVPPCLVVPVGAESAQLAGLPLTVLEALSWLWARASPPGRTTAPGSARARARRGRSGHYRLAPAPSIASTAEESRGGVDGRGIDDQGVDDRGSVDQGVDGRRSVSPGGCAHGARGNGRGAGAVA